MALHPPPERVYLVVWPDHMIAKAGITNGRRWRDFVGTGALVYRLATFDFEDWRHALDYENELHAYFGERCPTAFASRDDSRWLIGRLGGHLETYQLQTWHDLIEAPPAPPLARLTSHGDYYTPDGYVL